MKGIQKMNGILIVDKPKEYTSHDIVAIVKKITREKVGHTGTLDPNATGVLPLLIGKATALSKYLINHDKTYLATVKLGIKTDTADGEGNVIDQQDLTTLTIKEEAIKQALLQIEGKQEQRPPMYSAIKVHGKKLYEYARQGKQVEVAARPIEIYHTELLGWDAQEAEITFEVACSKGTYIRTVCETLAEKLGTIGYMKELRRTQVGEFTVAQAIDIGDFKAQPEQIEQKMISIEQFFQNKQSIELSDRKLELLLNGVRLTHALPDDVYKIYHQGKFVGVGTVKDTLLKRDIMI